MTAVLLLTCLGVDRETVLDDYSSRRVQRTRPDPHVVDLFVAKGSPTTPPSGS